MGRFFSKLNTGVAAKMAKNVKCIECKEVKQAVTERSLFCVNCFERLLKIKIREE